MVSKFYEALNELATQCIANLIWSHFCLIMRLESEQKRRYYLQAAGQQNWKARLVNVI